MDNETIYWHLPGIYYYAEMNHVLFLAMKKFPERFRDGYKIASVYGTFPCAIWNGGRYSVDGFCQKPEIEQIIKLYNDLGIPVRFTWTNVLLEEQHVYDSYCNMIMRAGNNGMNQVLVNRPVLEEYIRKTYPNYKIVSSTTKRILNTEQLMEEIKKDYYLVVLDYDLNHEEKVIEQLLPHAGRIEILVNETCQPHCPVRMNHYKEISKCQIEYDITDKLRNICPDRSSEARTFKDGMKKPAFMSNTDVEEYAKKGFRNFKIVGRGLGMDFYLDALIYYLVKDDSKDFIRQFIFETVKKMMSGQPGK